MLDVHIATCKYTMVPCPKECRDANDDLNFFMKKDIDRHIKEDCPNSLNRLSVCQFCFKKGSQSDIQIHSRVCGAFGRKKTLCPECDCGTNEEIEEHLKHECLSAVMPCKFKTIGCRKKTKRRDTIAHEQDHELHLGVALNAMVDVKEALVKLQELNTEETEQKKNLITFSVTDYEARKDAEQKMTSPSFYTSPSGYRMACRVYPSGDGDGKGSHVSVRAAMLEGKYDSDLKWPFAGSITFTLMNQLEDKNHYSSTTTLGDEHNAIVGIDWGKPKFIPHPRLDYDEEKYTQYLMNDTLYFRVSVEVADFKPWLECSSQMSTFNNV